MIYFRAPLIRVVVPLLLATIVAALASWEDAAAEQATKWELLVGSGLNSGADAKYAQLHPVEDDTLFVRAECSQGRLVFRIVNEGVPYLPVFMDGGIVATLIEIEIEGDSSTLLLMERPAAGEAQAPNEEEVRLFMALGLVNPIYRNAYLTSTSTMLLELFSAAERIVLRAQGANGRSYVATFEPRDRDQEVSKYLSECIS